MAKVKKASHRKTKLTAKKAPAKKAVVKKTAAAKKAPAKKNATAKKKAQAKKTVVKKKAPPRAAVKKAPAKKKAPVKKKAPTKKKAALAKKVVAKKAVAKKAVAKKAPAKKAVVKKAPAKAAAAKVATPVEASAPAKVAPPARPERVIPPARPAIKPRKGPLDKFLLEQQALLREERENYVRQAESLKAEADLLAREMEPGESEFSEEGGEGGNLSVERELDLRLSAQHRESADEIERALAKIDAGVYGICEKCGQPIPRLRLRALPAAPLCVACKSGGLSRR